MVDPGEVTTHFFMSHFPHFSFGLRKSRQLLELLANSSFNRFNFFCKCQGSALRKGKAGSDPPSVCFMYGETYGESSSSGSCKRTIHRDHIRGDERLLTDYFASKPVYPPETFRRRFQMQKHVFLRIVEDLSSVDPYFQQKVDALSRTSLSRPPQKCMATMRILAYGVRAIVVDDYV
ncbi:hypothetical protein CRG98_042652 [Punica granatum]|uniref:Uncharacterized protein n=1 Tax=Punica granatum TaxID=22663 RepID=A0A2I0HZ25_PUNGR|nr:hypothetical protein CRG98_042652 [Punica granatum]